MNLVGPLSLRLAFRAFIAVVGTLMLAGAVNTAIVGSIGVLNRVSEDGILPHWFRHPHRRFGTSHRILNLVVALEELQHELSNANRKEALRRLRQHLQEIKNRRHQHS